VKKIYRQQLPQNSLRQSSSIKDKLAVFFATGFCVGFIPKAPGTFGSIVGLILVALAKWYWPIGLSSEKNQIAIILLLGLLILFAYLCIAYCETKNLLQHDDQRIVIDEIVGVSLSLALLQWEFFLVGFLLFRFFDIYKMGPIAWADSKLESPWGTLLDDIFAGIIAGCLGYTIQLALLA
jgi:phosphatidylglycerophosphatase A